MKTSKLSRHEAPCSYDSDLAARGLLIIHALQRAEILDTDIAIVITKSLALPAGWGFFLALRDCPATTLTSSAEEIRLWSPMPRHRQMRAKRHPHASILIPNVYRDIPQMTRKRFASARDAEVVRAVARYADGYLLPSTPWRTLIRWFDACLPVSGYSPAMVGYCNFVGDFAMPPSSSSP
jgi:hypothetical protein